MKVRLKDLIKKYKKQISISVVVLAVIVVLILAWCFIINPFLTFKTHEKNFYTSIKDYYENYSTYMPKSGSYTTVSLQNAYDRGIINKTIFIPNSTKMCSSENSWVRIFNNSGDYTYYTYLECGMYKSNIDHTGPSIELNGGNEIQLYLNGTYEEQGVASVHDNEDGKMEISSVSIDSKSIDTSSVGTYSVKYVAYDKLKNRSEVIRKVKVVSSLADAIKADTNSSGIYKGVNAKNYVMFSGMLWRIMSLNEDGSVKIVLEDSVANMPFGNNSSYDESNVKKWLNNVFYNALNNAETYVKQDSAFCIDTVSDLTNPTCNEVSTPAPVGLISASDYNNSFDESGSYLLNLIGFWFTNKTGTEDNVWASFRGNPMNYSQSNLGAVRPVININMSNLYLESGNGLSTSPYKLQDYTYGKENNALNTRLIGEFVNYSNNTWRIYDIDDDGNIGLISASNFKQSGQTDYVSVGYDHIEEYSKFDITKEGNIGYMFDNEVYNMISNRLMVRHEFNIQELDTTKYYDELNKESFTANLSIPNSTDLFSGTSSGVTGNNGQYWLGDYITSSKYKVVLSNSINGYAFIVDIDDYTSNLTRLKIYLTSNAKIASGNGTYLNPYTLK